MVMRWKWILGEVMCKVFLVTDFTFTGNSVYIVVLVAYDRLALVTSGADYKTTETRCRAYFKLTVCWLFSFFLFSPAILPWEIISGRSVVPPDDCDTEFHQHFVFVIVTEVISFAFPFFSLTVISVLLFFALRKRNNKVGFVETVRLNAQRLSPPKPQNSHLRLSPLRLPNSSPVTNESDGQTKTRSDVQIQKLQSSEIQNSEENGRVWMTKSTETLNIPKLKTAGQDGPSSEPTRHMEPLKKGHSKQIGATSQARVPLSTTTLREGLGAQEEIITPPESGCSNGHGLATQTRLLQLDDKEKKDADAHPEQIQYLQNGNDRNDVAARTANLSPPYSTVRGSSSTQAVNLRSLDERRERRVALILAGLVLALAVSWLPYTISTIVLAACEECVNKDLYEFFNWLLWLKSCVNPFLYAYMSPRFRKNFQKLLGPLCPQACRK
ncbi:histamine H3 receptor-like [Littorina saxatilis]|uniref:histamine H3 receptor-like n=1 Tax=Littorina saxatilis TaxID=31220 RepID=UPI0038B62887